MECSRRGLDGLSQMAGIPASIGGAIRMNAGGRYGSISDHLHSVTTIGIDGTPREHGIDQLEFDYRSCSIQDPVITGATFRMQPDDPARVREKVKEIFRYKTGTQPLAEKSAGCVFRNPIGPDGQRISAGRLIDEAGLKGTARGGACISEHHANFFTTIPGSSTDDLLELIRIARDAVHEASGIRLETELVIWRRHDWSTQR